MRMSKGCGEKEKGKEERRECTENFDFIQVQEGVKEGTVKRV